MTTRCVSWQQTAHTTSYNIAQSYPEFSDFFDSLSSRTKIARNFPRLAISLRPTPLTFGNATKRSLLIHWYNNSSTLSVSTGTATVTSSYDACFVFCISPCKSQWKLPWNLQQGRYVLSGICLTACRKTRQSVDEFWWKFFWRGAEAMELPRSPHGSHAGFRVVRIDVLHFLAGCRKRRLNQTLVYFCLSMVFLYCVVAYYRHLFCIISLSWYVFCLSVVLVKLSVLAKWLVRKTPLRKPNCGEGIISTKPWVKSVYNFLGLVYCFVVLLCVVPRPYVIYFMLLWHDIAYLCWKCR